MQRFDRELQSNPHDQGESRPAGTRILFQAPVAVIFEVDEERRMVRILRANARARTLGQVEGTIKILADAKTDRILGVHILGAHAGDLINEAATADDLSAYLDEATLLQLWPSMWLPAAVRQAWEERFPELAERRGAAA